MKGEVIRYQANFDISGVPGKFYEVVYTPYLPEGGAGKYAIVETRDITRVVEESQKAEAREGNLQDERSFSLAQCEFKEFQLQLKSSDGDGGICLLKDKGEACDRDAECCSGKCKGPNGGKTCK